VSKSSVSRQAIEASEEELRSLCERRLEELKLLILYVDGLRFGAQQVLVAVGVGEEGQKHVSGLASGTSESEPVVKGLLEDLVGRGLRTSCQCLFVIDGSKALRAAVDAVFGSHQPVQRCRNHKLENVGGYLPKELKCQVKAVMRAAFRLPEKECLARLEKQAQWLEREYPSAAASLREGLAEMFTTRELRGYSPSSHNATTGGLLISWFSTELNT
jgi:putative transposase